jgi:hypothetical protein
MITQVIFFFNFDCFIDFIEIIGKNSDYAKLAKTLTTSTKQPNKSKFTSTLVPEEKRKVSSDLHQREALGHGVFLVRSRLKEGRENFEKSKVKKYFN